MATLTTATGRSFPCEFFGAASQVPVIYADLAINYDGAKVFLDPAETAVLIYQTDGPDARTRTMRGYTVLMGLDFPMDRPGIIRVGLRKPYAEEVTT